MRAAHHENAIALLIGTQLRVDADGSIWRIAACPGGGRPARPVAPRRAEWAHHQGYMRVSGNGGAGQVKALAHRVVWVHFNGPIPEGMEINHKNGIKNDNRPENLEIATPKQNVRHRFDVLHHLPLVGEQSGVSRLTAAGVREIRAEWDPGRPWVSTEALARRLGVSRSTVLLAAQGKTWKHIEHAPLRAKAGP